MGIIRSCVVGLLCLMGSSLAHAQLPTPTDFAGKWAWKPIMTHEGLSFSYIFYAEADTENNGVVLLLQNTNDYAISYAFKLLLRSEKEELFVEEVKGTLKAKEAKTGSKDGLFWIPFKDGSSVAAVGLRGYKITRIDEVPSQGADSTLR